MTLAARPTRIGLWRYICPRCDCVFRERAGVRQHLVLAHQLTLSEARRSETFLTKVRIGPKRRGSGTA